MNPPYFVFLFHYFYSLFILRIYFPEGPVEAFTQEEIRAQYEVNFIGTKTKTSSSSSSSRVISFLFFILFFLFLFFFRSYSVYESGSSHDAFAAQWSHCEHFVGGRSERFGIHFALCILKVCTGGKNKEKERKCRRLQKTKKSYEEERAEKKRKKKKKNVRKQERKRN